MVLRIWIQDQDQVSSWFYPMQQRISQRYLYIYLGKCQSYIAATSSGFYNSMLLIVDARGTNASCLSCDDLYRDRR
jgi:hypothetical protein